MLAATQRAATLSKYPGHTFLIGNERASGPTFLYAVDVPLS